MIEPKELKALISLLDDKDRDISHHVEQKIISLGELVIPFLEMAWEDFKEESVQKKIENLIHSIQFSNLKEKFKTWLENERQDLLTGMWLIAKYYYPNLELKSLRKDLKNIYYEIWRGHKAQVSPEEQIRHFNHIFFNNLNFTSNKRDFYAIGNSMFNIVLEKRRSNPIGLCITYMLIAQKLKMPVFGVNLPNLFILIYKSPKESFYINAFNKGVIFPQKDIDNYLKQLNIKPEQKFYEPCSNLEIIQRVARNLVVAFEKREDFTKADEVKELLDIMSA